MRRLVLVVGLVMLAGCTVGLDPDTGERSPDDAPTGGDANGTLTVHAIDVGQGDATLIEGPTGETMLIDSGDWPEEGETVLDYLDDRGIDRIDYLVSTHAHADHIGGHAAVIDHYETERGGIGEVWDPGIAHTTNTYERYLDAVEAHDVTLIDAQAGDELPIEGVEAVLYNPPAEPQTDDFHGNSLVLKLTHGSVSVLFTGDIETGTESRLVDEYGDELDADVYQAGHHGSSTSSSDELLGAVDPTVALVSSAYDSQYGHPHEETLTRFDDHGIDTYWTGVHGTTVLDTDGEEFAVSTVAGATADPASISDEPEADGEATAPVERRARYGARSGVSGRLAAVGTFGQPRTVELPPFTDSRPQSRPVQ